MKHADSYFAKNWDDLGEEKQEALMDRGRELWRRKYRSGFKKDFKREVLSQTSNLMIWSDNDVANDFTTMKNKDGNPAYHKNFLLCGMEMYRDYQRKLWDPESDRHLEGNSVLVRSIFFQIVWIFL